jgi:putative membrane protein insertion efficiency factor
VKGTIFWTDSPASESEDLKPCTFYLVPTLTARTQQARFRLADSKLEASTLPSMRCLVSAIVRLPRWVLMGVVRAYQLMISPHFPSTCRYQPTCSHYALQAFREYGAVKGLILTVHRLARCHPWGGHGYDPPRWFGEERGTRNSELGT